LESIERRDGDDKLLQPIVTRIALDAQSMPQACLVQLLLGLSLVQGQLVVPRTVIAQLLQDLLPHASQGDPRSLDEQLQGGVWVVSEDNAMVLGGLLSLCDFEAKTEAARLLSACTDDPSRVRSFSICARLLFITATSTDTDVAAASARDITRALAATHAASQKQLLLHFIAAVDASSKDHAVGSAGQRSPLQRELLRIILRTYFPRLADGGTARGAPLATVCDGNNIVIVDATKKDEVAVGKGRSLLAHNRAVNSVAFTSDNTMLASGSDDNSIILWNVASGEAAYVLIGMEVVFA
jgi:WD40 repeat protein